MRLTRRQRKILNLMNAGWWIERYVHDGYASYYLRPPAGYHGIVGSTLRYKTWTALHLSGQIVLAVLLSRPSYCVHEAWEHKDRHGDLEVTFEQEERDVIAVPREKG